MEKLITEIDHLQGSIEKKVKYLVKKGKRNNRGVKVNEIDVWRKAMELLLNLPDAELEKLFN